MATALLDAIARMRFPPQTVSFDLLRTAVVVAIFGFVLPFRLTQAAASTPTLGAATESMRSHAAVGNERLAAVRAKFGGLNGVFFSQ